MNKKVYMRLVALVFTIFWAFLPNNIFGQVVTYSLDLGLASSSTAFGNTTGYGPKVGTIGTIDWYISVGSCQPAGVWLGTNNATNHGLATLGAGTSGMEPAIAAALSINVTDPDYYCLVGINAIPNVDEVIVSATSISGTAPSDMWCLYTTNGGGSYTILGQVSALVANTNYSFTSTATLPANAEFAFVWHQTAFGTFRGAKFDFIDNSTTSTLFIEDFEDPAWATGGTNYANRTVTDNLGAWSISAVTSMTAGSDRFNGTRSARLRGNASDATNINRVEMLFDKPNGLGDLSFDYGSFSNHTGGVLETFYSIDGGVTWNSLGTIVVPAWGTSMIQQVYAGLNIPGNVRIKIEKHVQTTNSSVNIDDIVLTDFVGVPQVATPTFSPPGGNFPPGTLTVSISCATPGADIYYTTNGTNPVPGSAGTTLYTAAGISITTNTTITAIAIDPAGVLPDSNIASETYTFNFIEDFEDAAWGGAGAGNYNLRQVTDNFGQWTIAGVTQMQSDDRRIGTRSARFRGNASDNHFIQMDFDKPNGIGDISFYYGSYGAASGGILDVYYSIDGGTTWWLAGSTQPAPLWGTSMVQETFAINQPGNVRVKIEKQPQQGTTTTINIDDIELTDWFGMPTVLPLSFSPSPGTYNTQQIVNISTATPGASIYYTIGGAVPDITSTPYPAAGITVTTPTLIKAIAYEATHNHSNIAEAFFDVNLTPTIILSSTTHDFGNIEINTTSAPVTINVSGTNLTGIIGYNILGTDASAFTITPTATWNPATGEGDLEIEFKPTYLHAHNAFIRFDSVGAVDEDFYLFGTGVGTTIAAWTFPTTTGNAPKVHPAECGVLDINADIFADGTNGSDDWTDATSLVYFGGNAIPEGLCGVTTATGALSVVNIGSAYNGKSIVFKLSTLGYDDLQLTYDTRGTDTGFQTHEWYYSTDGTNFTLISTIPGRNVTTFSTQSVDFSTITALNNQSAVYIKLMVDGASGTGNNRLDNINFTALEGTYIPDPIILVSPSIIDFDEVKVGNTKAEDILVTSTNLTDPISYLLTGAGAPMFNIIESDWDPDTGGDLEVIFAPLSPGNYDAEITFSSNGAVNKIVQLVGIGVDLLPPVADFTADKTTILEGKTVQFTDISTGDPTSWEWTFTGGLPPISSDQNPIVTYNTAGIYDVELKAINDDGFSIETKLGYITVFEGKTYTLVTDMTEFEDGSQYLFVSEKNSIDYAMGWQKAGNRHAVPVVINGNIIEVAPATEVTPVQDEEFPYEITIVSENSDWLLFDALNNKYLRPRTGTDNGLVLNELKAYWSLAIDGSSAVSLICTGSEEGTTFDRNVMRFNPNGANPPLFACYASGQNDFYIYKADAATPMLSVSPTELDFGDVKIGNTSLPQTINVDGYNLLANISYNITGTGAAAFNISTTNWDPTIGGQLFITFEPIAEDDYEALLTFSSTDAVERTVTLLGSGLSLVLPVADFIADNTDIFVEESVQFTDLSTGAPISWEWTFTGGTPATSTLQNPIVEYNTIGIFDVSLTVTNEDGNHTETKTGYINVVGQEEKTYVLVTSMSEVEDGAQYLFVS
ncbi:MAG: chitobiase/beta-hexosaminidase C-terminal domain-containing protein, partial [Marinilabiliaceae bacterium]|nr:chitobiase/beta-hexosaminidase C-terminal domain-containing protein [Marinilabiliaceae bacterium]